MSQLSGNQNTKTINALSESLCEVPYTETTTDVGTRERRQEQVFDTGSQHWGRYCCRMMNDELGIDGRSEISF